MTYNEWRDELKNNLLTVSDAERRRVLDYYAEAYADRREAGFTEREIIDDFGAPYDAAQRILFENSDDYYQENNRKETRNDARERTPREESRYDRHRDDTFYEQELKQQKRDKPDKQKSREDYTWLFVLLCIIFAAPLFGLVMAMFGITVGLCVAPFSVLVSGFGTVGAGIGEMFSDVVAGAFTLGTGIIVVGVGLIIMPLCFKLVKLMWKLFNMFFKWLRGLFSGKEKAQ